MFQIDAHESSDVGNHEDTHSVSVKHPIELNENDVAMEIPMTNHDSGGYEELLRIEGSTDYMDTPPAEDLRGNIKALRHALQHQLVFNNAAADQLERQSYTRHKGVGSSFHMIAA